MYPKQSLATMMQALETVARETGPGIGMAGLHQAVMKSSEIDADRRRLVEEGKTLILKALSQRAIRAFAFEEPRRLSDSAVELDARQFRPSAHFRWEDGILRVDSLRFVEVRFMNAARAVSLIGEWHEKEGKNAKFLTDPSVNSVGRPSIREDIQAAFHALNEAGKIDPNASCSSHYPMLRKWLAMNCSHIVVTDTKPGDEALRRHIKPLFDALANGSQKL